jgi:lipoate-protein ligase A
VPEGWEVEERVGDADALHANWPAVEARPDGRALAICRVTGPALVLGSTQPETIVDGAAATAAGVAVARRRSGGGVVLVTPDDPVWIDVWVPVGDPLWRDDVGRAFDWLGDAWVDALRLSGVTGVAAHRLGHRPCTRWSSLVCFGGVGTGEVVTEDGRKVVGLAQRRNRSGSWFHSACVLRWEPAPLVGLLSLATFEREAAVAELAAAVVGAADLATREAGHPIEGSAIIASLIHSLPAAPGH